MKIPIDEMRALCRRILLSHRLTEDEATIIADDYLDGEMREIMTGPFLGVDVGLKGDLSQRGALCLFFLPSLFGVKNEVFNARVNTFSNNIKNARVAARHEKIFLPGEQGERRRRKCLQGGVIEL